MLMSMNKGDYQQSGADAPDAMLTTLVQKQYRLIKIKKINPSKNSAD